MHSAVPCNEAHKVALMSHTRTYKIHKSQTEIIINRQTVTQSQSWCQYLEFHNFVIYKVICHS